MAKVSIQKLPILEMIANQQNQNEQNHGLYVSSFLFLNIATAINNQMDEILADANLSAGRFTLLSLLRAHPKGLVPSELSELLGVTHASISGLLKKMETDQQITRVAKENDKRSVTVQLTPFGNQLLNELTPRWASVLNEYWKPLNITECDNLSTILLKIHEGLPQS